MILARVGLVVLLLVTAMSLVTPPVGAAVVCDTGTGAFCVTYEANVYQPGTTTDETRTQRPVTALLSVANSSTNHLTDQSVWIRSATGDLLSTSTSGPLVLGSAQMPDGLLVSGSAAGCGAGADSTFSACESHGGIVAHGQACGFSPSYCSATFGIQRVYNNTTDLGSHFIQLTAEVSYCVNAFGFTCAGGVQSTSFNFAIDRSGASGPLTYAIALGSPPAGVDDWAFDNLTLRVNGSSSQLSDGSPTATTNWLRLPTHCGTVAVTASLLSDTTSVSDSRDFSVTGCVLVSGSRSRSSLTYGGSAVLSGSLTPTDADSPSTSGAPVRLRSCPVGLSCVTTQGTTSGTGAWSFTVTPSRNTSYTVSYPGDGSLTNWIAPTWSTTVSVRPLVTIKASSLTIKSGGSVKLTGSVKPSHAGKIVVIQRKVAGDWKKISTATLSAKSLYSKSIVLKGAKGSKAVLRVVLPAHADHLVGTSKTVTITFG